MPLPCALTHYTNLKQEHAIRSVGRSASKAAVSKPDDSEFSESESHRHLPSNDPPSLPFPSSLVLSAFAFVLLLCSDGTGGIDGQISCVAVLIWHFFLVP
mmetsp:Transcript_46046/g.90730  ORF Transcript_46046/g.90730 Transcript_46046/m.90730 type:complete len:100 (+) Transcript_46046:261-560(+)